MGISEIRGGFFLLQKSIALSSRGCVTLAADCCLRCWRAAIAVGKIVSCFSSLGGLGNGPRVNGFDLADHFNQHVLFCRQDLVAAGWGVDAAAGFIDGQFALTFVLMGIVFLAAQLSLGYIVWKYRERPSSPPVAYSHGNVKLEIVVDGADHDSFRGIESDGQQRVGEPAL